MQTEAGRRFVESVAIDRVNPLGASWDLFKSG